METLIQVLIAILLVAVIVFFIYFIAILIKLRKLLENLSGMISEIASEIPSLFRNFNEISRHLASITSKTHHQVEALQGLLESFQSYFQRIKNVFSPSDSSSGFSFGLVNVIALIKAIRAVITKLKA